MSEPQRRFRIASIVIGLGCLVTMVGSPMVFAAPESHGTLVADDGADVYDWELDALLDIFIGSSYHSRILAFTECYGGDKIDDFAGDPDTTILSGSTPGNTTDYGGYHRGLAQNLKPGSDTDTAHAGGVANASSGDSPTTSGPNQDVGTGGDGGNIQSTHVLVWAGDPNSQDQDDINDIHGNFDGQPNTTVTVLSGDGTGANVDGAATFGDLVDALDTIGDQMNSNEQFILFVTDHGDLDTSESNVGCPGFTNCPYNLDLPPDLWNDMLNEPDNVPYLALFTAGNTPIPPGTLQVSINAVNADIGSFQETELDFDNDGLVDKYEYQLFLSEDDISVGPNAVLLSNLAAPPIELEFLSLDSGAIKRLSSPAAVPAADYRGVALLVVGLGLGLWFARRKFMS